MPLLITQNLLPPEGAFWINMEFNLHMLTIFLHAKKFCFILASGLEWPQQNNPVLSKLLKCLINRNILSPAICSKQKIAITWYFVVSVHIQES